MKIYLWTAEERASHKAWTDIPTSEIARAIKTVSVLIAALEDAQYFIGNVPTDEQLDAPLRGGRARSGRDLWGKIEALLSELK